MATTAPTFTDDQVRAHGRNMGWVNDQGVVTSQQNAQSIYDAAKSNNVSADQLNRAFGWTDPKNNAQTWMASNNKAPLGNQAPDWMDAYMKQAANSNTGTGGSSGGSGTNSGAGAGAGAGTNTPANNSGTLTKVETTTPVAADTSKWDSIIDRLTTSNNALMERLNAPRGPAQQVTFDESKGVAGRTQAITADPNSPLMQQAAAQGRRDANSRGVLNSTAGVRAAQDAMIARASDIAAADASLFNQTQLANMREANAWETSGLDRDLNQLVAGQNNALQYSRLGQEANQFDRKLASDESQFTRQLNESGRQADMTNARETRIADMNFNLQDRRLSQDDRQFLATMGLEERKLNTQIDQFAKQFGLSTAELELNKDRLTQQDRQFYDDLQLRKADLAQRGQQFTTEWENRFSLERMSQTHKIDLARLDGDIRGELIGVEAAYKKDIASNENISGAWGTMMQEVGRIQNNADLEPDAKNTLINNALDSFRSFTGFWKKVSGGNVDVSDLLNFGPAAGSGSGSGGASGGTGGRGGNPNNSDPPGGV